MEEEVDTETVAMLSHMGFSIKNSSKISRIRPGSSGSGSSSFSHGQMTRRVRVPTGIPMLLGDMENIAIIFFFAEAPNHGFCQ